MTLLEQSITHWEENVAAETPDRASVGWKSCALCREYFVNDGCDGCPVAEKTGKPGCWGTPYVEAYIAYRDWKEGSGNRGDWKEAARAELEFLKGLRK